MNRAERRKFNKQHKTSYTKADFDAIELYNYVKAGDISIKDLSDLRSRLQDPDAIHIDNEEMVPEGTPVKLQYDEIMSRPKKDFSKQYLEWIEEHKNDIMHVTRENSSGSLVCLQEDKPYLKDNITDEDTDIGHTPWLFDVYTDFMYYDEEDGEWMTLEKYIAKKS